MSYVGLAFGALGIALYVAGMVLNIKNVLPDKWYYVSRMVGDGLCLLQNVRRAVGVEISEAYCEIIARRLDQGSLFAGEPA